MTNKETKEILFNAIQLLMEIYKELSERATTPKLTVIEFKSGQETYVGKPMEVSHE